MTINNTVINKHNWVKNTELINPSEFVKVVKYIGNEIDNDKVMIDDGTKIDRVLTDIVANGLYSGFFWDFNEARFPSLSDSEQLTVGSFVSVRTGDRDVDIYFAHQDWIPL